MLASAVTMAEVLRPSEEKHALIYDITSIVAGSLLIGLSAQLAMGYPVPVTGQTFAVLLVGALLGAKRGALCLLLYLTEGTGGMPVFSQGQGGPAILFGPTGGYLIGFIAAAYVVGMLAERGWDRRFGSTVLTMMIGNAVLYFFGLAWLTCLTGSAQKALAAGLYPFIIGDLFKILLAAILLPCAWKLIGQPNHRRNGTLAL